MTSNYERERDNQSPIPSRDLPLKRHNIGCEDNHHGDARKTNHEWQLEALPDPWHFDPEGWKLDFFTGRSPSHVVREQMRQQSGRQMNTHSTKEEQEEWDPSQVLKQRSEEIALAQSIL